MPSLPADLTCSGMLTLWLTLLLAIPPAWITLTLLGNERQHRRAFLEHQSQVHFHHHLTDLRRRGML